MLFIYVSYFLNNPTISRRAISPTKPFSPPIEATIEETFETTLAPNMAPWPNIISAIMPSAINPIPSLDTVSITLVIYAVIFSIFTF